MKTHPIKRIALSKIIKLFVTKLMQHPDYYNIRYYRKAGRLRNRENLYL
jgi:hypothetical protein